MNTPHTPGEWLATEELAGVERHDFEITAGSQLVAVVEQTADIEVGRANARLIAAAPALLSALERLSKSMDDYDGNIPADIESPYHQARLAILKATTPQ
jgi:hypothetical protein